MWLFLPDAFLSVVAKDCPADSLMVRARRPGDIERLFPAAMVTETLGHDYLFRAVVPRIEVARVLSDQLMAMDYPNFKDEVHDRRLHDACSKVWRVMADLQPVPPYSRARRR